MCLYSTKGKSQIADEDISCYKVLLYKDGRYITPFQDFPVQFEQKMVDDTEELPPNPILEYFEVTVGYFHSCRTLLSVRNILINLKLNSSRSKKPLPKIRIFKATIPKGSVYFDGLCEDYCSKELIIHNEVVDKI